MELLLGCLEGIGLIAVLAALWNRGGRWVA
jgi:hypothetical protein